jgi:prepilin-type N-terminal cleavage/methylation domain-containing protein
MRGFTLLETAAALVVLGVATALALPPLVAHVDRLACVGAREELAGLVERARAEAGRAGAAALILDADSAVAWIEVAGVPSRRTDLRLRYGVSTSLSSNRSTARMAFDRMGVGRFANGTVHLSRGRSVAALVVSSYGRVRRR